MPAWIYKLGHALKDRRNDIYPDFTNKSALNDVNLYILGVVAASVAVYVFFYGKYLQNDAVRFWLFAEFFIIIVMRLVIHIGKSLTTRLEEINECRF